MSIPAGPTRIVSDAAVTYVEAEARWAIALTGADPDAGLVPETFVFSFEETTIGGLLAAVAGAVLDAPEEARDRIGDLLEAELERLDDVGRRPVGEDAGTPAGDQERPVG